MNTTDILSQFSKSQKMLALIIILGFPVVSFLGGKYIDTDDCRPIIEENLNLHNDIVNLSTLIRQKRAVDLEPPVYLKSGGKNISVQEIVENNIDSIIKKY